MRKVLEIWCFDFCVLDEAQNTNSFASVTSYAVTTTPTRWSLHDFAGFLAPKQDLEINQPAKEHMRGLVHMDTIKHDLYERSMDGTMKFPNLGLFRFQISGRTITWGRRQSCISQKS